MILAIKSYNSKALFGIIKCKISKIHEIIRITFKLVRIFLTLNLIIIASAVI